MDPFLNELLGTGSDEFQASTKTEEEIKKLTLEENMTETKRCVHILSRGQHIQKNSVYANLHKILLEPDAYHKVLPLVAEEILNQTEENQIDAAKSLKKLINTKGINQSSLIQIFHITCSILKIWNQGVLDEWVLVFNELLKKLPYELIAKDCEYTIMNLSESSQHTLSKYVSVRLVGFIAENNIKGTTPLFDRARILCQDPDYEIRKVLAEEVMLKICYNAGTELTESKYLEKIMELLYDSNINIKLAAIDAIVKILDILSQDYKKTRMITVFLELMNSVNEEVMKRMSFHVGTIVHKLEDVIPKNSNQLIQIQNIYRDWSTHKNLEIRKNIIFNLPYMIKLFDNKEHFRNLYLKALRDTNNKNIRLIAVASFHEICRTFKAEEFHPSLKDAFETLLKDTDQEVIERLTNNLADLITVFQPCRNDDDDIDKAREEEKEKEKSRDYSRIIKDNKGDTPQVSYLGDFLKMAEQLKANCIWRSEIVFMNNINKCFDYFDIKELGDKYVTYLIDRITRGIKEVRKVAIASMVNFFKRNYISKRTNEIVKTLIQTFQTSTNYQFRIIFVEIYGQLAENFSRRFIKSFSMNEMAVKLMDDKVPDVRKRAFENGVLVRKMLNQNETSLIVKLDDALNRGRLDSNKYASEIAKETLKELKSLTQFFFTEFDEEDKKRMLEEDLLKEKEQKEVEDSKKKPGDDLAKDKGDYLYAFSSIIGGPARKGVKKNTFKTDLTTKTTKTPMITSPQPITGTKGKTTTSSYTAPVGLLKTHSSPSQTNLEDDKIKDGISKTTKSVTRTGISTNGSSNSTIAGRTSINMPSSGTGIRDKNKIIGESSVKTDTKISSLNKGSPTQDLSDKSTKDYVKVPTIKKKV